MEILTRRIPVETAKKVSTGVLGRSGYGTGGRVLFSTDSAFVALRVEYASEALPTVCNHCISYGFDLYKFDKKGKYVFAGVYRPANNGFYFHSAEFKTDTISNGKEVYYALNIPHFAEIKNLNIGIEKRSKIGAVIAQILDIK